MRVIVAVSLFVSVLAFPSPAFGCSCAPLGVLGATRAADVVFTGTATNVEDPDGGGKIVSSGRPLLTTFEVDGTVKGELPDEVVVRSAADGASCGIPFDVGHRYRVFGTAANGDIETGLCSGTKQIKARPAAVANPDAPPGDGATAPEIDPASSRSPLILTATIAVALLAIGSVAALVLRRRRPRSFV